MKHIAFALVLFAQPVQALDLGKDWIVSDWPAGQSSILHWSSANVRLGEEGIDFVLDRNPAAEVGAETRPYLGGEVQSKGVAETGVWSWRARAPKMVEGAVFGMFLYRADHEKHPWREYDIEFVGGGTTEVELNIHFEDASGRHVSLLGGPKKVDLGFDAAEGFHDYEIEVKPERAIFRIDGKVVGEFGPADVEGSVWSMGPLRSFVDLWAVQPAQAGWAGVWDFDGVPLTATLEAVSLPPAAR